MLNSSMYISDQEMCDYRQQCSEKIYQFNILRSEIQTWYDQYDFRYPYSSENNYRDSWFHYRKLYQERNLYEIISQKANFEEHLQRAEKDSVIYFLQQAATLLEYWYLKCSEGLSVDITELEQKDSLNILDEACESKYDMWPLALKNRFMNEKNKFADACIFCMKQQIMNADFQQDMQILLHDIKNTILRIRMSGSDILREQYLGNYLAQCRACYDALEKFCDRYRIKTLLCITEEIISLS